MASEALIQELRDLIDIATGPYARFAPGAELLAKRVEAVLDRWERADGR